MSSFLPLAWDSFILFCFTTFVWSAVSSELNVDQICTEIKQGLSSFTNAKLFRSLDSWFSVHCSKFKSEIFLHPLGKSVFSFCFILPWFCAFTCIFLLAVNCVDLLWAVYERNVLSQLVMNLKYFFKKETERLRVRDTSGRESSQLYQIEFTFFFF